MATLAEAPRSADTAPADAPRHWGEMRLTEADLAHIPGEAGWPVVGNTFTMLADPHAFFYVCGLKAMEEGVVLALKEIAQGAGLDWEQIGAALKREGRLHLETY